MSNIVFLLDSYIVSIIIICKEMINIKLSNF